MRTVLVTATPPTTNGDLHLGHLSGPYLAADIYTRYLRLRGVPVHYVSGADDHQTYVALKAQQTGKTPAEVAQGFGDAIEETLRAADIAPDLFVRPRASRHHIPFVQEFVRRLHADGKLAVRTRDAAYCERCDRYLWYAHLRGRCPHCGREADGNSCEDCGRPNLAVDLVDARCRHCGGTPALRPTRQLTFPLQPYAGALREYYRRAQMNPHVRSMCEEMLAAGLPEVTVSHVADWGIPVPLEGFEDQRLDAWFEMGPGYLAAARAVLEPQGQDWLALWRGETGEVVHFFGFDNTYFHAVLFPAQFLAYDPRIAPAVAHVTNEFYRLEGLKFSTSRMHAVWGREACGPLPPDLVRFYLAYSGPEAEQTNFSSAEFVQTIRRLADEWNAWLLDLGRRVRGEAAGAAPDAGPWTDQHRSFFAALRRLTEAARDGYERRDFSPQLASRTLWEVVRVGRRFAAAERHWGRLPQRAERATALALELAAARTLAMLAAPIMPRFASRLWRDLGQSGAAAQPAWEDVPSLLPPGQAVPGLHEPPFPQAIEWSRAERVVA